MINRSQLKWIFISLVALRLIIGFHFFTEGKKKIDQGDWSAAPFFSAAHGPLAPYFKKLLPDSEKLDTLCVVQVDTKGDREVAKIDTEPTFGYWAMFLQDVLVSYKLSQPQIKQRIEQLTDQMGQLDETIAELKKQDSDEVEDLLRQKQQLALLVRKLAQADPLADMLEIIERRKQQLNEYVNDPVIQDEILKAVADEKRLSGFVRDGVNRDEVATYVESLRGQVDSIEKDVKQVKYEHASWIEGIWTGLESELNAYGSSLQSPLESSVMMHTKVELQRPFGIQKNTPLYWINLIVPYFDLTVGILLLVGLFSRLASLAAAGFLLGIILTQPIWVPGYDPKIIYQIVEFGALLVLGATVAGRYGGLDYFLWLLFRGKPEATQGPQDVDLA